MVSGHGSPLCGPRFKSGAAVRTGGADETRARVNAGIFSRSSLNPPPPPAAAPGGGGGRFVLARPHFTPKSPLQRAVPEARGVWGCAPVETIAAGPQRQNKNAATCAAFILAVRTRPCIGKTMGNQEKPIYLKTSLLSVIPFSLIATLFRKSSPNVAPIFGFFTIFVVAFKR